ncbi:MAG: hypothetical protein AAGI01_17000 [Myxococcota bacterium]
MTRTSSLLLVGLALASALGCETQPNDAPQPWGHTSTRWGYDVTMPAGWATFPASDVHERAEFTARRSQRLFMVLPTQMPELPKLGADDVRRVQEQSVKQLATQLGDVKIERQGRLTIDGVPGYSVFLSGLVEKDGARGIYILSYVYREPVFLQIVAYAPEAERDQLRREVDDILTTWRFLEPAKLDDPEPETQDGTP